MTTEAGLTGIEARKDRTPLVRAHLVQRRPNRANPTGRINGWKQILNTLAITYGDRVPTN